MSTPKKMNNEKFDDIWEILLSQSISPWNTY